ncbi:beta-lactamase [Luteipulveratus mongoliensis]|uniref:Beta-lactamase n=1 Tax=Luteipulveratus mongoliensis TaxID=571913 RepID=A0A0K1JP93_9MICO|nr:beta-lactamase [Luteipulveratus mongoliensis]
MATYCAAAVGTARGLVRPRWPDHAYLESLHDAGLPNASATVTVRALRQASKTVPTPFVAEGVRRPRGLRIAMTAFVVEHPTATFVVDPSICVDVMDRAFNELPLMLRLGVRPPADLVDIGAALDDAGLVRSDLAFALPTHLHWDHVSGLLDLPGLPVRLHTPEREWAMTGPVAPVGGVRPALADRPIDEYVLDGPPVLTFPRSHDLMGDGSVVLVDLAGHTPGSVGVLLHTATEWVLIAGDAAWHLLQVEQIRQKMAYPGVLADEDRDETFRSLHRLHAIRDQVRVVPTHDHDAARALRPA